MKEIKINVYLLVGIILFVLGLTMLFVLYFNQESFDCINNPVDYANNNSDNYWWDDVTPISYSQWLPSE